MRHAALSSFMQMLRRVAARHARDEQADAELLARFARQGDEVYWFSVIWKNRR
jgi:hypothetical protein